MLRKLNPQNKDSPIIKISSARTIPLIKILRRQARRERKVVRRRSRKRFHARYKFIITRASKHAAGFLARSRHFLLWTLSFFSTPVYPSISTREISPRLPASFASLVSPSYETRIVYRLKNFIIRSRFSFVFQFDFYRAAPGKRQVHNVVHPSLRNLPISLRCSSPPPSFSLPRYLISN